MIRRSSRPCSFFAAWYSKFSERSPKPRATRSPRPSPRAAGPPVQPALLQAEPFGRPSAAGVIRATRLQRTSDPTRVRTGSPGTPENSSAPDSVRLALELQDDAPTGRVGQPEIESAALPQLGHRRSAAARDHANCRRRDALPHDQRRRPRGLRTQPGASTIAGMLSAHQKPATRQPASGTGRVRSRVNAAAR